MELITPWLKSRGHLFDVCSDVNDANLPVAGLRLAATSSVTRISREDLALYACELLTIAEFNAAFGVLCMLKLQTDDQLPWECGGGGGGGREAAAPHPPLSSVDDCRASRCVSPDCGDDEEDRRAKKLVLRNMLRPHISPAHLKHISRTLLSQKGCGPFSQLGKKLATPRRVPSLYELMISRLQPASTPEWPRHCPEYPAMRLPLRPTNLIRQLNGPLDSQTLPHSRSSGTLDSSAVSNAADGSPNSTATVGPACLGSLLRSLHRYYPAHFLDLIGVNESHSSGGGPPAQSRNPLSYKSILKRSLYTLLDRCDTMGLDTDSIDGHLDDYSDPSLLGSIHRMSCFIALLIESTHQQLAETTVDNLIWVDSGSESEPSGLLSVRRRALIANSRFHPSRAGGPSSLSYALPWYVDYSLVFLFYMVSPDLFPVSMEPMAPADRWRDAFDVFRGVLCICAITQNFYRLTRGKPDLVVVIKICDDAVADATPESPASIGGKSAQGNSNTDTTHSSSVATTSSRVTMSSPRAGSISVERENSNPINTMREIFISQEMYQCVRRAGSVLESHFSAMFRWPVNPNILLRHVEEFLDLPCARKVDYGVDWDEFAHTFIGSLTAFSTEPDAASRIDNDGFGVYDQWRSDMYRKLSGNFVCALLEYYERLGEGGGNTPTILLRLAESCVRGVAERGEFDKCFGPPAMQLSGALVKNGLTTIDPAFILPFVATDVLINIKRCARKLFRWSYGDGSHNMWLHRHLRECCHVIEMIEDCEKFRPIVIPPKDACPWLNCTTKLLVEDSAAGAPAADGRGGPHSAINLKRRTKVSLILIDVLNSHLMDDVIETAIRLQHSVAPMPLTYYEAEILRAFGIEYDRNWGVLMRKRDSNLTPPAEAALEEVCVSIICRWLELILNEFKNFISWNFLGSRIMVEPAETPPLSTSYQWCLQY